MGKKKRGHPNVEEILARAWCYYCERDFEDLKLLIQHQKAKHFKCDKCGRRLNTAGGLSVHMNQVHKESLSHVENALPNRQGLDVEIFGMEGIPEDIVQQHNQRIIQNFYQAQADRFAATGNPPPGQNDQNPAKRVKMESTDEIKKRLAEHRARIATQKAANGGVLPQMPAPDRQSPAQNNPPFSPHGQGYPPSTLPSRLPPPPGLPTRPGQQAWSGGNASTIDELVAGAASGQAPPSAQAPAPGDDIDHLIRMAEAGIKPAGKGEAAAEAPAQEKKSKKDKDKNVKMIYEDEISPEERMAVMPRYAYVPQVVA